MKYATFQLLHTVAVLACLAIPGVARAESPSLLLEKGLYAEQTEGDLDKAIGLYQQIIDEAEEQKKLVGSAHLRIGICLLKAGKTDAGASSLQTVLAEFPGDATLVAQANAAAKTYDLTLTPADSPIAQWQEKLEACTNHKQAGFSVGPMLVDSLEADGAHEVVAAAWPKLANDDVKTGICKAFAFPNHPRVLDVLHLAMTDDSMAVKSYAKTYVGWYAYIDFAEDYSAYGPWYAAHRGQPLAEVAASSLKQVLATLPDAGDGRIRSLEVVADGLSQYNPDPVKATVEELLVDPAIAWLKNAVATTIMPRGQRPIVPPLRNEDLERAYIGILQAACLDRARLENDILPLLENNPTRKVSGQLLSLFTGPEHAWVIDALVRLLVKSLEEDNDAYLGHISFALRDIGDPRAIPAMIGVIQSANTPDTVRWIGGNGLSGMTGVRPDDSHDGTWWADWWVLNRDQYPEAVRRLEIPRFEIAMKKGESQSSPTSVGDWHLGAADRSAYAMAKDEANEFRGEVPTTLRSTKPEPPGFATLLQQTSALPYRGLRCWLNAQVKSENVADWSGVWMRVDDAQGNTLAFDNMESRPIKGTSDWAEYHVVLDVPTAAKKITYGLLLHGAGQVWLADVEMQPAPKDLTVTANPVSKPGPGEFFLTGADPKSYEMGDETEAPHPDLETRYLKSVVTPKGFGTMMADIPPTAYLGKRCILSAMVKAENVVNWAGLWMRVDGAEHVPLAFDNMQDRPIKGSHDWKELSVVLDVPESAESIAYGLLMDGEGQVWVADLKLEEAAPDTPLTGQAIEQK